MDSWHFLYCVILWITVKSACSNVSGLRRRIEKLLFEGVNRSFVILPVVLPQLRCKPDYCKERRLEIIYVLKFYPWYLLHFRPHCALPLSPREGKTGSGSMVCTEWKTVSRYKILEADLLQQAHFPLKCVKNPRELPGDEDDDQYTDYFLVPIENV